MYLKSLSVMIATGLSLTFAPLVIAQPGSQKAPIANNTPIVIAKNYQGRSYRDTRSSYHGRYQGNYNSRNYYRAKAYQRQGYYPTKNYYRRTYNPGPSIRRGSNYFGSVHYYPTSGYNPAPYNLGKSYRNYQPYAYSGSRNPYGKVRPSYKRPYFYRTYYYPSHRYRHYKFGRPASYRYGHYRAPSRGNYVFWPIINYRAGYTDHEGYHYYPTKKDK